MHKLKQAVKRNPDDGNRTGIPTALRKHYEEISGLSFGDVRIHYNSQRPERLGALAYTQGNHVYIAPGQERHLRHELGHVVQQKRGLVRPNEWVDGFPVNTEYRLEQQAERGSFPISGGKAGSRGATLVNAAESPSPVREPVSEDTRNTIQGMFLKWMRGEESYLAEADRSEKPDYNTAEMHLADIFQLLVNIRDETLILRLSEEISDRLYQLSDEGEIRCILNQLPDDGDTAQRIIDALDDDCFNWLMDATQRVGIGKLSPDCFKRHVQSKDLQGVQSYWELRDRINDLEKEMQFLQEQPDGTDHEKSRKQQLLQLLKWEIRGYCRLLGKYPRDIILQDNQRKLNALEQKALGLVPDTDSSGTGAAAAASSAAFGGIKEDRHAVTYAAAGRRITYLPARAGLSAAIRNVEPVRRSHSQTIPELAGAILAEMERTGNRDRLVIYRSMDATEALSLLQFFHSSKAAAVEAAIKGENPGQPFSEHDAGNFAEFGRHFGEYNQAKDYTVIRMGGQNHANVLMEFVLKPGAGELLFSKSALALPSGRLWQNYEGFAKASGNEGMASGYIGIKAEQAGGEDTYSFGVSQNKMSRMLLQLLVDRVDVKRILYHDCQKREAVDLSAAAKAYFEQKSKADVPEES